MPYNTIKDLPSNITTPLPAEAQRIYLRTFNAAYAQCKAAGGSTASCESVGRVAGWHNVGKKYKKSKEGKWVKKESEDTK